MLQDSARVFKILQETAIFYKILQESTRFCKILQDSTRFCKILQDSASLCKIFHVFDARKTLVLTTLAELIAGRGKPRLEKNEDEPTNQPTYLVHHVILQEGKQ